MPNRLPALKTTVAFRRVLRQRSECHSSYKLISIYREIIPDSVPDEIRRLQVLTAGLFLLVTLLERDVHLGIAARRGSLDSGHNSFDVAAQNGPLGIAKNNDGDFPSRQVLLIAKVVRSQQQFKTPGFGGIEEGTVRKPFPTAF